MRTRRIWGTFGADNYGHLWWISGQVTYYLYIYSFYSLFMVLFDTVGATECLVVICRVDCRFYFKNLKNFKIFFISYTRPSTLLHTFTLLLSFFLFFYFSFAVLSYPTDYFSLNSCNWKNQFCVARKPGSDRGCECKRMKRKWIKKMQYGTAKKACQNQVNTIKLFLNFSSVEVSVLCEERSFWRISTDLL